MFATPINGDELFKNAGIYDFILVRTRPSQVNAKKVKLLVDVNRLEPIFREVGCKFDSWFRARKTGGGATPWQLQKSEPGRIT